MFSPIIFQGITRQGTLGKNHRKNYGTWKFDAKHFACVKEMQQNKFCLLTINYLGTPSGFISGKPILFSSNLSQLVGLESAKCPIHVVTFTLISNLATDYIQKRRGEPGLFSFEYNLSPNLISK